jgi:hypothetical protein
MVKEVIVTEEDVKKYCVDSITDSIELYTGEKIGAWRNEIIKKEIDISILEVNGYVFDEKKGEKIPFTYRIAVNVKNNKIIAPYYSGPLYSTIEENNLIKLIEEGNEECLIRAEDSIIKNSAAYGLTRVANSLKDLIEKKEGIILSMHKREMI